MANMSSKLKVKSSASKETFAGDPRQVCVQKWKHFLSDLKGKKNYTWKCFNVNIFTCYLCCYRNVEYVEYLVTSFKGPLNTQNGRYSIIKKTKLVFYGPVIKYAGVRRTCSQKVDRTPSSQANTPRYCTDNQSPLACIQTSQTGTGLDDPCICPCSHQWSP